MYEYALMSNLSRSHGPAWKKTPKQKKIKTLKFYFKCKHFLLALLLMRIEHGLW